MDDISLLTAEAANLLLTSKFIVFLYWPVGPEKEPNKGLKAWHCVNSTYLSSTDLYTYNYT